MLNALKKRLRAWLFSNEEVEYQAKKLALKQMQESVNIVTLARTQLAGFDPKSINEHILRNRADLGILDGLEEEDKTALMNNIHALHHNPALQVIIDYLIRSQVLHGQMEAESVLALNFSRATVNGLLLFKDEVANIEGQWQELHKQPDNDFDEHEVV